MGRRPKVDSDAFQHGFYPPGDMDYHTHAYWAHASMEHPHGFKSEPIYSESGDEMGRDRVVYGEVGGLNYAMKPEPFCHGHQQVNGRYGQEEFADGQHSHHRPQDGRLAIYQHHPPVCMPPEAYTELSQSHHPQGAQIQQQWSSELSPTASASGSEDNWDSTSSPVGIHRAPSSVSSTLPEVQSGAAAALVYANLYRGKIDADENATSNNHNEGAVNNTQLDSPKLNSRSYTELVPRKADSPHMQCSRSQSVTMYHQELKSRHLHSPTQGGAGSVSPHHTKTSEGRNSPWESSTSPGCTKRKLAEKMGDNVGGKSQRMMGREQKLCKSEQLRLVQELMDNFLPLEKVVTYQWQAYLQSYGEVSVVEILKFKILSLT